ncbi:MAG: hypothetical protein PF485_13210 [Bacteroidales bacterium]|jgi:hypothetical protein|nr:hypothetical protein [Bacteroidales bacterium]
MEDRVYKHRTSPFLRGLRFVGFIIMGAIAAAGFAFLFGYFVMLLWNWIMPELFGLVTITFWKAAGIVLLARLIFGGFKHGPGCSSSRRGDFHKRKFFDNWCDKGRKDRKFKDWKYFDDFWSSNEGEQTYNDYVDRRKEQDQK